MCTGMASLLLLSTLMLLLLLLVQQRTGLAVNQFFFFFGRIAGAAVVLLLATGTPVLPRLLVDALRMTRRLCTVVAVTVPSAALAAPRLHAVCCGK